MTQIISHHINQTIVKLVPDKGMGCEQHNLIDVWIPFMTFSFYDNGMRITTNDSISNTTRTRQEQGYMFPLYTDSLITPELQDTKRSSLRRVRKITKSDYKLRHVCLSVYPSVNPSEWSNSALTAGIFMILVFVFLYNLLRKFKFY
jgi:hypothetical protein